MGSSVAAYANDQLGSDWSPSAPIGSPFEKIASASKLRRSISNMMAGAHSYGTESSVVSDDFAESLSSFGAGSVTVEIAPSDGYLESLITDNEIEQIKAENESLIRKLLSIFVFEDATAVHGFLEDHPSVPDVLLQAAPILRKSFGDGAILQLQIPPEEDVPLTLYAVALWDGPLEDARVALNRFDDLWWNAGGQKGSSRIVFDYQLV